MAVFVLVETSTAVCSVALSQDDTLLFSRVSLQGPNHASLLGLYVEELMGYVRSNHLTIDAVCVSGGPGSYTGLRIGLSMAKGLCWGLDVPLIALDTLQILSAALLSKSTLVTPNSLLCPMIDARRMEVYAAIYRPSLEPVRAVGADIITPESYREYLEMGAVFFFGDGADKCRTTIMHPNSHFVDAIHPLAEDMIALALQDFDAKRFVDRAYFEPYYLKEFMPTTAKKLF